MKVAVLIPVYNAEKYLRECLDSALCAGDELLRKVAGTSFEIFCCDDGSKDGSLQILREYAQASPRVHFVSQSNQGVVVARNRLLDELPADVDAFLFLDSDDFVAREMYAKLAEAMVRTNADIAECEWKGSETVIDDMSPYVLNRTAKGRWINVINKLYRRSAVGSIRFRKGLAFEEDNFFNFEVHRQVKRKVLVPGHYYTYRTNPDSATNRLNMRRYFESVTLRLTLSAREFLAVGRIPKALEGEFRDELVKAAYRMCVRKNLKKNKDSAMRRELFFEARTFLSGYCATFGLGLKSLNPIQRALFGACLAGRYALARLIVSLT